MRLPSGGDPEFWISGGIGIATQSDIADGRTQSTWRFGQGLQWRGGLDYALGGSSSIGLVAGFARMPLTYEGGACLGGRCDADANMLTAHIGFHAGGGQGFHQVLQISAGVTRFSDFQWDQGTSLPPDSDTDFSFSLGYGFGYGISQRTHIFVVQDFGAVLHQREGLTGGSRTLSQQHVTRAGVRFGMGARR